MKKLLLNLFLLAVGISTGFAQTYKKDMVSPFFEAVNYQGAFPVSGSTYTINLYGQPIKNSDGTTWNNNGSWTTGWTNWDPQNTIYPGDAAYNAGTQGAFVDGGTKSGDVTSNQTWGADNQKTLIKISGAIHVTNGATLTIKPNTIIRGDASNISFLLVAKGAKLVAIGFPDQPIVFTSNKAPGSRTSGDWAGFLLMGKSQNNTSTNGTGVRRFEALPADPLSEYGGGANFDIHDNSGECRFLRVEFAGYNYLPDQEINGVTFGAVGDQTRFDFCQVSFSRDDSYEWFGGSNDHKYLVAWAGIDDEFDMDEGYQGRCQFLLGVRKNDVFETSAGGSSHGFEHDNNTGWGTSAQNVVGVNNPQPSTRPVISNATLIGPRIGTIANITGNRFNAGMAFRTGDESCVYNTIVTGYPRQFEFFHNGATLTPSAHQKFIGVSDIGGTLAYDPAKYTKNEVMKTVLITDISDNGVFRSGKGPVNGATLESQAVPNGAGILGATFDPATANYASPGTLLDNNGFPTIYDFAAFGNTRSTTTDVTALFTQPIHTILAGTVPTLDFTLKNSAQLPVSTGAAFTSAIIANNILSNNAYSFSYGPTVLPNLFQTLGNPSPAVEINVSAFGLTSTGISIAVTGAGFQVSTDGLTYGTSANLSVTGGSIWVRYNATTAGDATGSITINTNDGRANAGTATINNIMATAIAPSVPFVQASVGQLPNMYATLLNTAAASSSVFTVAGNLLSDNVTISGSSNFWVSTDNSTWVSSLVLSATGVRNKWLDSKVVYATYKPTIANNPVTVTGGAIVAGSDNGVISIASTSANSEYVNINGKWGVQIMVGPKDANGNIAINGAAPSFPQFSSFSGLPSPAQVTYIKANGVPAGQTVIVNALGGLQYSYDNVSFTGNSLTFTPDASGNVPATPFYVRYKGTGSLSAYASAGSVVAVGLQGTTAFDVLIGTQGATESISVANNLFGYITTVVGNALTFTNTTPGVGNTVLGFSKGDLTVGSIITSANAGASVFSFEGIVTTIDGVNNIVYLDRNFTTTAVNKPLYYSASGKTGSATIVGIAGNVLSFTGAFSPAPKIGAPLYNGAIKATNFAGVITAFDNTAFTITYDNTNAPAGGALATNGVAYYDNSQVMFNVQSSVWQSNKDYNRAALWFTDATLADATHANATGSQVITVSGNNTPSLAIGRDLSTVYSLAVEVSLDNTNWSSLLVITSTGIVPPTPVYVRYNPTGSNNFGTIAGSPTTLPGFGQHTGAILENNSTTVAYSGSKPIIYTVGFSDPILYTSGTPVSAATNSQIPGQIINQLADLYAIVGTTSQATPLYIYGSRLQNSQIAITSDNSQFKFSTDMANWSNSLNLTGTNSVSSTVYVKYAPTSTLSGSANIYLSTTKSQQSVKVNGFAIPVPQASISTSAALLTVNKGSMGSLTVEGSNLSSPITVTAPSGFMVWATSGTYSNSVTLVPNTLNYGDVAPTMVLVTFTGTTSISGSLLSLATAGYMTSVTLAGLSDILAITPELIKQNEVAIYPNPTENGEVTIVAPANAAITIYSLSGTILYSGVATEGKTQVSGLASGFNIVRVGNKTFKLIVK